MVRVKKRIRKKTLDRFFFFFFAFLLLSILLTILIFVETPAILFRKSSETTESEISPEEQKLEVVAEILKSSSLSVDEKKERIKQLLKNDDLLSEWSPNNLPKLSYEKLVALYCEENSDKSAERKLTNYQRFKEFRAFSITGNGNCFFNAISFLLTGNEKELSDKLRLALIKILINDENIPGICG